MRKSPYFVITIIITICKYPWRNVKRRFGLKWFNDLSWFPKTEQEILTVYEAPVSTNREKTLKLA